LPGRIKVGEETFLNGIKGFGFVKSPPSAWEQKQSVLGFALPLPNRLDGR